MSTKFYRTIRLIIVLVIFHLLVTLFLQGFEPIQPERCRLEYNTKQKCYDDDDGEEVTNIFPRIAVYLTVHDASWYNDKVAVKCNYQHSETDALNIENPFMKLNFERIGNILTVNGKSLEEGETFRKEFVGFTPWRKGFIEVTNEGIVKICDTDSPPKIVIQGNYGTFKIPSTLGENILWSLGVLLVLVNLKLKDWNIKKTIVSIIYWIIYWTIINLLFSWIINGYINEWAFIAGLVTGLVGGLVANHVNSTISSAIHWAIICGSFGLASNWQNSQQDVYINWLTWQILPEVIGTALKLLIPGAIGGWIFYNRFYRIFLLKELIKSMTPKRNSSRA